MVGFGLGFGVFAYTHRNLNSTCDKSKFFYINQQLACDDNAIVSKSSYAKLKSQLDDFIQTKIKDGEASDIAVYFRDLQNGPTLGINEHDKFVPASLLKVPLMLAYLDLAEDQPKLLETKVVYQAIENQPLQNFPAKDPIIEDKPYTLSELIQHMIDHSDNSAYFVLLEYLKQISPEKDLLKDLYTRMGIIDPQNSLEDSLSVKSYSSILVQLYHSSFFDKKETSEKALEYMADTDFNDGIVAGVPSKIRVAHKFGERANLENDQKQLHDCGIIYYPGNPYLLCVMTRGNDWQKLTSIISSISKTVYEEFDSRRLK